MVNKYDQTAKKFGVILNYYLRKNPTDARFELQGIRGDGEKKLVGKRMKPEAVSRSRRKLTNQPQLGEGTTIGLGRERREKNDQFKHIKPRACASAAKDRTLREDEEEEEE
uniref:Uncharacterized protein n=1 Tax=Plectus sambesii TaxID=2011161 RepID=A0A914WDE5_9BILA